MTKIPIILCALLLGCAVDPAPHLGSTLDGLTFEQWLERQPRFGDSYLVQGDMFIDDLELLRRIYQTEVSQGQALAVAVTYEGDLNVWSAYDKTRLDYCINTDHFEPGHLARLVLALDTAMAAWESVADVDFRHRPEHDGPLCGPLNNAVKFDVRYHACNIDTGFHCDRVCDEGGPGFPPPRECNDPEQPPRPPPDDFGLVLSQTSCAALLPACVPCRSPGQADCTPPADAMSFFPSRERPYRSLRIGNSDFFDYDDITIAYALRHELGHALGFVHEFTRDDVVGDERNRPGCEGDSNHVSLTEADLASVMMYGPFSGCSTYNGVAIPQPLYLSPRDQQAVAGLYGTPTAYDVVRPNLAESFLFGVAPGDYDGNGVTDVLVRVGRSSNLQLFANDGDPASPRDLPVTSAGYGYGGASTQLMPGRYHHAGFTDFAIKEDATGLILIDWGENGLNGWDVVYSGYGFANATVAPADYDGDGLTDLSIKDTAGYWHIDYSGIDNNGGVCASRPCFGAWNDVFGGYGDSTATPVPADYDGDRRADLAIKNTGGAWNIDFSSGCTRPHGLPCFGAFNVYKDGYGFANATPIPADYDCDGRADLAIKTTDGYFGIDYWEPSYPHYHGWNLWPSGGYGDASWIPVPGKYHLGNDRCIDMAQKRRNVGYVEVGVVIDKAYDGFPGVNQILLMTP